MTPDRNSRQSTFAIPDEDDKLVKDEDQRALLEAENGLQQFDEVLRMAERAISSRQFELTPLVVEVLNRLAIQNIRRSAGKYRTVPIGISNSIHEPPRPEEVERHVQEMCAYVNTHWHASGDDLQDAIHLAAYLMWRLNWIHPFRDGNGRTSRAVSYLVLTIRLGQILGGEPTIPDQIVDNKLPYYDALDDADAHWRDNRLDLSMMQRLIERLLEKQLDSA